ncbi:MAG: apolipoprotein N-acyltransferase [Bdellovibrionota bacterium]
MRTKLYAYRLPILAGFLIGTSYIPFPPWALFFCLVPLMLFWRNVESAKSAFIGGWITQFILNLLGFPWIAHTAIEFGHFPVWAGALTLMGFAAIAHLHFAIGGALGFWLAKKFKTDRAYMMGLCTLVFAFCWQEFPMIFPWHLGYPWLWAKFPGAQFADVIGFDGLNHFTILVNFCLASAVAVLFLKPIEPISKRIGLRWIAAAVAIVAALNVLGLGRAEPWRTTDAELKILAVQGNIGNYDKQMVELGRHFRDPVVAKFIELSQKGLIEHPEADAVIWPETAFPDVLDIPYQSDTNATKVRDFVRTNQKPLLTGAYSYEKTKEESYNGFFIFDKDGVTPLGPYRKTILLVFGETFPFSEYIPYMGKLFPNQGSFGRGSGPTVMSASIAGREIAFGPQICYEGLYPWFSQALAAKGAEVFTNVTNDSWFGRDYEPFQHLYMTFARSIEFRRPLIRATNTGITTGMTASGDILQFSPQEREWTGLFRIPYKTEAPHTIYEKICGIWRWVLALGLVLLLAFGRRKLTEA